MHRQILVQIKKDLNIEFENLHISNSKLDKILLFLQILQTWNKKTNLTAISNPKTLFQKHILDSITPLKFKDLHLKGRILDLGSGAGLPGIIIALLNPKLEVISVEKVEKKIIFQNFIKGNLELSNFHPQCTRIEVWTQKEEYSESFDWVISRAYDQLSNLLTLSLYFLKERGNALFWKGSRLDEEIQQIDPILLGKFKNKKIWKYKSKTSEFGGRLIGFQKQNVHETN